MSEQKYPYLKDGVVWIDEFVQCQFHTEWVQENPCKVLWSEGNEFPNYPQHPILNALPNPKTDPLGHISMKAAAEKSALETQVGGDHYRKYKIQPIEFINANGLSFLAGNIVKYATRYKDKGGAEDVKKIIHYAKLILEFEYDQQG